MGALHIRTAAHPPTRTHLTGLIGEARFIEFACKQGWYLYRGVDGHTPCDFIADTGECLLRVEVKRLESVQRTDGNYYYCCMTKFDSSRFDYVFVSTPNGDYWIPAEACPRGTLSIKHRGEIRTRTVYRPGKYEGYLV